MALGLAQLQAKLNPCRGSSCQVYVLYVVKKSFVVVVSWILRTMIEVLLLSEPTSKSKHSPVSSCHREKCSMPDHINGVSLIPILTFDHLFTAFKIFSF